MKRICITYHMTKENEVAETCITIAMEDTIASDILQHQGDSRYVKAHSFSITIVKSLLANLAALQGYTTASFCCADPAEKETE